MSLLGVANHSYCNFFLFSKLRIDSLNAYLMMSMVNFN